MKKFMFFGLITMAFLLGGCSKTSAEEVSSIMKQSLETRWSYGIEDQEDWELLHQSIEAELDFLSDYEHLWGPDGSGKFESHALQASFGTYHMWLKAMEYDVKSQMNPYLKSDRYKEEISKKYNSMAQSVAIINDLSPIIVDEKYKANLDYMLLRGEPMKNDWYKRQEVSGILKDNKISYKKLDVVNDNIIIQLKTDAPLSENSLIKDYAKSVQSIQEALSEIVFSEILIQRRTENSGDTLFPGVITLYKSSTFKNLTIEDSEDVFNSSDAYLISNYILSSVSDLNIKESTKPGSAEYPLFIEYSSAIY
ncbi:uncharacterized protein EM151A_2356 [Enterococcus mundtii]|uniref:Uncharacterized protein n=1 Tax=Enterococcus mundtii TaxID=53346 RepID=A0AAI8RAU9_ENTMU|nr:hypothetical protein [Enterococcus mundtii]BBM15537.1 uncharacterized protein EM151A_2356 [Enterococcus mundtii]